MHVKLGDVILAVNSKFARNNFWKNARNSFVVARNDFAKKVPVKAKSAREDFKKKSFTGKKKFYGKKNTGFFFGGWFL